MIKFSIIVAAFNVEKTLFYTLNSLEIQNYKNFEVIIVNDASTDLTHEIIENFIEGTQIKKITYYVNKKNLGLSEVRNYGIQNSNGEYILFLDGDDIYHSESLNIIDKRIGEYKIKPDLFLFSGTVFMENIDIENMDYTNVNFKVHEGYNRIDSGKELVTGVQVLLETKVNNTYRDASCLIAISKVFLKKYNLKLKPGIVYEDLLFTRLLLYKAHTVGVSNELILLIRKSNFSITRSPVSRLKIRSLFIISIELFNLGIKENQENFIRDGKDIFMYNLRRIKKSQFLLFLNIYSFPFLIKMAISEKDVLKLVINVLKEDLKKIFGYTNNL